MVTFYPQPLKDVLKGQKEVRKEKRGRRRVEGEGRDTEGGEEWLEVGVERR